MFYCFVICVNVLNLFGLLVLCCVKIMGCLVFEIYLVVFWKEVMLMLGVGVFMIVEVFSLFVG